MLSSSSGLLGPMGRSIRWKDPSTWILIVLGSLITLTAGPATANLMRPRTIVCCNTIMVYKDGNTTNVLRRNIIGSARIQHYFVASGV